MLKDILNKINKDGYFSNRILAKELNVTEDVISDAISQLIRMGYIVKEESSYDCSTACGGCPFAQSCNKEIIKTYQISEKGKLTI